MSETGGTRATVECAQCGALNRVDLGKVGDGPRCGKCQAPIRLDAPVPASDRTLERILRDSPVPVLVDFHAEWCGPCHAMAPVLAEVARARAGTVIVVKVDTDRNPGSAARFEIRGLPTLVAFEKGKERKRQVGAVPRQVIESML